MTDQEYLFLRKRLLNMTGIDLDSYKSQQMRRRLSAFIESSAAKDVVAYCHVIQRDELSLKKLCDFLTINVTEFFRDEWAFKDLQNLVLPEVVKYTSNLNIWSAGCSNGAEAFSLAMLLKEMQGRVNYRILGTDMDLRSLEKAGAGGPFKADSIKNIPQKYVIKYFTQKNNDFWVNEDVREKISFRQHNLLVDSFEKEFDLIACRNVTIYFTNEAKDRLNQRFHNALNPKGVLFIGATEFIPDAMRIGFSKMGTCFYRKELTAVTSSIG